MNGKKIDLPAEMVEKYLYLYGNHPTKDGNGSINCGCPICREGNSWGKKRRLYYFPEENYLYCFNCNRSWSPIKWIMEVSGKNFFQVIDEAKQFDFVSSTNEIKYISNSRYDNQKSEKQEYPPDAIVLGSDLQRLYYSGNKTVNEAINFYRHRLLDKAVNVPKYAVSLKDKTHKNRLLIPFTDLEGNINFFQSRSLPSDTESPKYLSMKNSEKTVFGVDKIDIGFPYIFITEGPIDSCFIKNGVSLAGLKYTNAQTEQLSNFFTHQRIWVLDNDFRINKNVMDQYEQLIDQGETIFIWPEEYNSYKDINEYCIATKTTEFPNEAITANSYRGLRAKQILKGLK